MAPGDGGTPDAAQLGPADASSPSDGAPSTTDGGAGLPGGWLYTRGNAIYVADGQGGGTQWMGRGVNLDDLFLCGFNNTLAMSDAETTLETIAGSLISDWKPNFVRVSLGMDSYPSVVSWSATPGAYQKSMTNVIDAIGAHPGVYVLLSLRSDASMVDEDTVDGDPEATGVPSSATDATYVAMVDSFAHSPFVLFGLSNEPGGNKVSNSALAAAMDHAVGVIRKEEDQLGVPHHLVSVQGNGWTSDIGFYATTPLAYDNVVYEIHGYPPLTSSYTYPNLPVILGEYGSLADSAAFYADVEAKQIPNLAWDFEPYSDCTPDLLTITHDAASLVPTAWGQTVKSYLLAHHP